jgi:hypothetical protein
LLAIDGAAIPPILKKLQALSVEGGSGGKSDPNEEAHKRGSKSMRDGLVAVGDGKGVDSETAALEAHMSVHALYLLQVPSRISSRHNAIGQLRELMAALGLLQKLQSVGLQHSLTGGLTCMLADESIWRTVLVCVGGIQVSGERQKELELPNDLLLRERSGREQRAGGRSERAGAASGQEERASEQPHLLRERSGREQRAGGTGERASNLVFCASGAGGSSERAGRASERATSSPALASRATSSPALASRATSSPALASRATSSPALASRATSSPALASRATSSPALASRATASPALASRATASPALASQATSSPRSPPPLHQSTN